MQNIQTMSAKLAVFIFFLCVFLFVIVTMSSYYINSVQEVVFFFDNILSRCFYRKYTCFYQDSFIRCVHIHEIYGKGGLCMCCSPKGDLFLGIGKIRETSHGHSIEEWLSAKTDNIIFGYLPKGTHIFNKGDLDT